MTSVRILLLGGPYDGATLDVDPTAQPIDEVVFRTTEYHPGRPREIVYRLDPAASLQIAQEPRHGPSGARVLAYRATACTQLLARVREQDRQIRRLEAEVNRMLERRTPASAPPGSPTPPPGP